ncbi:hypothetical protein DIJ60_31350, partial [Burkholderia pseudomallei]
GEGMVLRGGGAGRGGGGGAGGGREKERGAAGEGGGRVGGGGGSGGRVSGVAFDGFQRGEVFLEENKGNYVQFIDGSIPKADKFCKGFDSMEATAIRQSAAVRANPPARLMWYFQTPLARQRMLTVLRRLGITSILQP